MSILASPRRLHRNARPAFSMLAAAAIAVAGCVDAPSAPDGAGIGFAPFAIQPSFTLVAPRATVASAAVADALSDAFDRVDRFRITVVRPATGAVLVTVERTVTPGQNEYDLSVEASGVSPGEQVLVTVVALEGTTVLFESEPIQVRARSANDQSSGPPLSVPLVYAGPGAQATDLSVGPGSVLVAPGAAAGNAFTAEALDADGSLIANVPVSWSSASEGVATVDAGGVVTGTGEGLTRITATIPTGLEASAWAYVVAGEVAFESGGAVMVRSVASGSATDRGAGSRPAWSADGSRLVASRGGTVTDLGTGEGLFEGSSPAVSPDGSKIAAESGGTLIFANSDGSNPTTGPAGTTPAWASPSSLVVGGGSVERVRADGTGRTTVAGGGAMWPALSDAGTVAWVDGGALVVDGATVLDGVDSRPTWSPNGLWIVASVGGELMLVPANGSGPAAPLGASGTFPAWKATGGASQSPSAVSLTGLDPEDATPGGTVQILGAGFDWIIPANNRAFFPTPEGETEVDVLGVSESALTVRVPDRVSEGTIRVATFGSQSTLPFTPALGSVAITATTPWGAPVPGVRVVLSRTSVQVADVRTGDDGTVVVTDLEDGVYTVAAVGPSGFQVTEAPPTVSVTVGTATALAIGVNPLVQFLSISPEVPSTVVGGTVDVTATAIDINGDEIPQFDQVSWIGLNSGVAVSGTGLQGTLKGVFPSASEGGSTFRLIINGQIFERGATVRSHIGGKVKKQVTEATVVSSPSASATTAEVPEAGAAVQLRQNGNVVRETTSAADGSFLFGDLFAGDYELRVVNLPEDAVSSPVSVTLDPGTPVGSATLLIKPKPPEGVGDLVAINDWNAWDTGNNPPGLVQTLVSTANNDGTKVVWWCGRQANRSGNALSGGICASSITSSGGGQFSGTRDAITAAGWSFEVDDQTPLTTIGDDVRVFWLWTPTEQLTNTEVNVLKAFAARGGRIVFNADYKEDWYFGHQHADIATRLFGQLGVNITSVGTHIGTSSGAPADPNHPLAQALAADGITSVRFSAPGDFTVSSPAVPLIVSGSNILIAYGQVLDTTPLAPATAPASIRAFSPPPMPVVQPPCRPGTVCGVPPAN